MTLKLAKVIAKAAHYGQHYNVVEPYFDAHVVPVYHAVMKDVRSSHYHGQVAYLHDVVEDTNITLEDLEAAGFDYSVVVAVDAITRREGELYFEYIHRVKRNRLAKLVKYHDLQANLHHSVPGWSQHTRYTKALEILMEDAA
jgi:(p)ppGpp synthase/HD superfamily hydrolase